MTAYLAQNLSSTDILSFFYCRFDDEESLKAKTIIGSIVRQLVTYLPATAFLNCNYESTSGTNLVKFLETALNHTYRYFNVLDGLNECQEQQIKEVVEIFNDFLTSPVLQIKIFWSTRPTMSNSMKGEFLAQQHIKIDNEENQKLVTDDIRTFIHATLEEWLEGESPELELNDPGLVALIISRLEEEACGM